MKKTFDAVQWMRQRRAQIDEEDRGLSWDEKRQKTRECVLRDPILAEFCAQKSYSTERPVTMARQTPAPYGPGAGPSNKRETQ